MCSSDLKQQIRDFDPVLAKAQVAYGESLAKIDSKCEDAFREVTLRVDQAHRVVQRPAEKLSFAVSGVHFVLGMVGVKVD